MNYKNIKTLELETTCAGISQREHDRLYHNAKRANKRAINRIVKNLHPYLFKDLALNLRNPYPYYRTDTHIILVHSATDYFIRYSS